MYGKIIIIFILTIVLYTVYVNSSNMATNKFESYRLGNVIDVWYFSKFSNEKKKELKNFVTKKNECFSYYLINNINRTEKSNFKPKGWGIYYYDNIIKFLDDFHIDLRKEMEIYDKKHNNILFDQKYESEKHCIIHYRLGDVVTLGDTIDYRNIIDCIRELSNEIDTIEIMDGGQSHHPIVMNEGIVNYKKSLFREDEKTSGKIYNDFYNNLKSEFKNMKIIKSQKRTTDEDFFRMVSAPILITGGGSYALASAIASKARIIRTPSCKNLDHPKEGCIKNIKIPKKDCDWKTYQYSML